MSQTEESASDRPGRGIDVAYAPAPESARSSDQAELRPGSSEAEFTPDKRPRSRTLKTRHEEGWPSSAWESAGRRGPRGRPPPAHCVRGRYASRSTARSAPSTCSGSPDHPGAVAELAVWRSIDKGQADPEQGRGLRLVAWRTSSTTRGWAGQGSPTRATVPTRGRTGRRGAGHPVERSAAEAGYAKIAPALACGNTVRAQAGRDHPLTRWPSPRSAARPSCRRRGHIVTGCRRDRRGSGSAPDVDKGRLHRLDRGSARHRPRGRGQPKKVPSALF